MFYFELVNRSVADYANQALNSHPPYNEDHYVPQLMGSRIGNLFVSACTGRPARAGIVLDNITSGTGTYGAGRRSPDHHGMGGGRADYGNFCCLLHVADRDFFHQCVARNARRRHL